MPPAESLSRYEGAIRVARHSLPMYALAAATMAVGTAVALLPGTPLPLRGAALLGVALALWLSVSSFLAFHWIFDRSELTRWQWLRQELDAMPRHWVHVSSGLLETHAPLADLFPGSQGVDLDIYDAVAMPEPAITRARRSDGPATGTRAPCDALPVAAGWADAVVVVLAAHEIRDVHRRERFFHELHRILSSGGTLVLIEHPRNLAAALAFGPLGWRHFLAPREWARLQALVHLQLLRERRITPFVRVYFYRRQAT